MLSSTGRRYKTNVAQMIWAVLIQKPQHQTILHTFQRHYLTFTIRLYLPSLLRRDVDSGLKITQDAICEALSINDNRIVEIHLYKSLDPDQPRMECALSLGAPLKPADLQTSRPSTPREQLARALVQKHQSRRKNQKRLTR